MKTVRLDVPYTLHEIGQGALDLLRANEFRQDVHFVPVAFFGMGAHNFNTLGPTVDNGVYITAVPWPQPAALWNGATACVASWRRISDDTVPPRLKAGANYQNSRLAQTEARVDGYDTAIILNQRGTVAEGPGACLMMMRDGKLITPPVTAGILESITRTTLMDLATRELGVEVVEREIDRTELYVADEVFMCGSGLEVLPITSVDRIAVGDGTRGSLTKRIQDVYFSAARGEMAAYRRWLTPVYAGVREAAGAATR
jgi:branched-chain amino acid aminotransferase